MIVFYRDGQKMSKRKKNYPDPLEVVHKYGADALRYVSCIFNKYGSLTPPFIAVDK
jgi:isoleucyl-tRNA synthetase